MSVSDAVAVILATTVVNLVGVYVMNLILNDD